MTIEQIKKLYTKYLELIDLEVGLFGVKPTEVRHLIGRLGEFYCAIELEGTLAHTPNQHGFDVICKNKRKVSVKTTAQRSGFIAISSKTADLADDLMIIQYAGGQLSTLYYGCMTTATEASRHYSYKGSENFELDILKAKNLGKQSNL